MILALAGGVGGARMAAGLAQVLAPKALTVAVNTGDDFEHLGLAISPDLDSVMYTLAGHHNPEQGWGLAGESWCCMQALATVGGETWFRLGDLDLATHLQRTARLSQGASLSEVTAELCAALGVRHHVVPMSDQPLRTRVKTDEGELAFQDYFVRRRCVPRFRGLCFEGAGIAGPSPALNMALQEPALEAIVICPSNPLLSIRPMLALTGFEAALRTRKVPTVAVSPIIGAAAMKGPLAKIMGELGLAVSSLEVARLYAGLIDGFVIDEGDADQAPAIEAMGIAVRLEPTLIPDASKQRVLADAVLAFARVLGQKA